GGPASRSASAIMAVAPPRKVVLAWPRPWERAVTAGRNSTSPAWRHKTNRANAPPRGRTALGTPRQARSSRRRRLAEQRPRSWLLAADLLTVDDQRLVVRAEREATHVADGVSPGHSHELARGHLPDADVPHAVAAAHGVAAERGAQQLAVGAEGPGHFQLLGPPDVGVPKGRPHGLTRGDLDHLRLAVGGLHSQL